MKRVVTNKHLYGLEVKEGEISKISGISNVGKQWVFENNDPQIYIEFKKPIYGIRVICDLEIDKFSEAEANLYYRRDKEDYSEEYCCKLQLESKRMKTWEIKFDFPVFHIRFDPLDFSCECNVNRISFQAISEREFISESLNDSNTRKKQQKIVVLTHDMSITGAPILAYHIAKGMKEKGMQVVALTKRSGDGFLEDEYRKSEIPVINMVKCKENEIGYIDTLYSRTVVEEYPAFTEDVVRALCEAGYRKVIANTIVSGEYVALFKKYGFRIISLIHEMKTSIEYYGYTVYGNNITKYSDLIVFPNSFVMQDFESLYTQISGKCIVHSQGVYLKDDIQSKVQNLEQYGIDKEDFVVMSSGTCVLRKGVDLFVDAAMILSSQARIHNFNVHYIWTGNFDNEELNCWLTSQIERSGLDKHIHFIPFIKDSNEYRNLLKRATVFWALSREDPFPSTVLEAMKVSVPVVGFKGSGGIETMLSEKRGILVEGFNLADVAASTLSVFLHEIDSEIMVKEAKKYVDEMDFGTYVEFLYECAFTDKWMDIKKDKFSWNEGIYYFEKQLRQISVKDKKALLDFAIKRQKRFRIEKKINISREAILLDTAKGTDNIGDEIIMDYCEKACRQVLPKTNFHHIPTHIYDPKAEKIKDYVKILCGTNLIYTQMENSRQWSMPQDISNYKNICLLGVGMQQIGIELPMSDYSKKLLRFMLSREYFHSVRDEETKKRLAEIGIKNVINTGCPTTWRLSREHCAKIPQNKARTVLTTITDYMRDPEKDSFLINILRKNYEKVYIWIQGQEDYEYLQMVVDVKEYNLIPPSLKELDNVLQISDLDYVGTRLHAGIRSLNYGHRTLIIGVDNRARAMAKDINLPVIERQELETELEKWICSEQKMCIHIPEENILRWKKQFIY